MIPIGASTCTRLIAGDLFDDFEMARAAARAAIEAIAKDGRLRANLRCTMGELFRFLEDDLERGHSTKAG